MIKKVIVTTVFIIIAFPSAFAQVSIINEQEYLNDEGIFHIVGEVENNSYIPLNQVVVTATLYSIDNKILGIISTDSILETIMPGNKGPFDLVFFDNTASQVYRYVLDLKYMPTEHKSKSLEITSAYAKHDAMDNFVISGTVVNHDQKTANTVVVIATLYDKDGKVVTTGKTYTESDYLISGGKSSFLLSVFDKTQSSKISDYSLYVESEEYTAVPEFPLGSGIILSLSVISYLIFTRKPRLQQLSFV